MSRLYWHVVTLLSAASALLACVNAAIVLADLSSEPDISTATAVIGSLGGIACCALGLTMAERSRKR